MSEGYQFARLTCRSCGRQKDRPAQSVPVGSHERWRCVACGHRGADITIIYSVGKPPANVVPIKRRE